MTEKTRPILIPAYLKEFQCIGSACENTCCAGLPIIIEDIPNNLSFQIGMGRSLIKYRLTGGFSSKCYLECLNDVIKGLSLEDETPIEKIIENYKHASETYYSPFMQGHEYMLENYMVNYVFKNLFPSDQSTLFESYTMLVINVILMKVHLIGMSAAHKGLSTDLVIKLIQSYTKVFDHKADYIANVRDSLKESGYSTMAHMAVLIKS